MCLHDNVRLAFAIAHYRTLPMALDPFSDPSDLKPGSAVGIGAGDLCVGKHPVIGIQWPLLGRKQREQGA